MQLCNQLSREELRQKLEESGQSFITISFYRYLHYENPQEVRDAWYKSLSEIGVLGRIYIAHEGVNAQIAVPETSYDAFRQFIDEQPGLDNLRLNIAVEERGHSFLKLKIKVRPKILADGLNDETFDVTNRGQHLKADDFNRMLDDENTVLIDMRNHYETEVGHFQSAITPDVDTFRESLPKIEDEILKGNEDKNIVMYCTGGIRCEKASAWFKHRGFENVYQLEGGIIKYAHDVGENKLENKFIGKNFVFDDRREERISEDVIANCHQCGEPFDIHTNCVNDACHILFIQCEKCAEKYEGCCSEECQEIIHLPEEEQRKLRKGRNNSNRIFKKGKGPQLKYKKKVDQEH